MEKGIIRIFSCIQTKRNEIDYLEGNNDYAEMVERKYNERRKS